MPRVVKYTFHGVTKTHDDALLALGQKVAHSPGYLLWGPGSPDFSYTTSDDASNYMYGALGVAAFGREIGEELHEDC